MPRAFIGIDIDEEVRKKIVDAQEQLKATGADLKLVDPPNIHVTMKFLGDTSDDKIPGIVEILKMAVGGRDKFDIGVRGVGVFPNPHYIRVIWTGVEVGKEELFDIHGKIEEQLHGFGFRQDRYFVPHLTIARVRTARMKDHLATFVKEMSDVGFGVSRAQAVELKQSTLTSKGPIYNTLARIELG